MHDLRMIREHIELLREGMRRRGKLEALSAVIDRAQLADAERRALIQAVEERKGSRNSISQAVARARKAGEKVDDLMTQSRDLGEEIARLDGELGGLENELKLAMLELPNVTLPGVPAGGEENNSVVRSWGTPRPPNSVKPHWENGVALGIVDFERGAKISGSGFIVFRSGGARLVRSLINFAMDIYSGQNGYEETGVPVVVNRASMTGTTQLPKFEDDMYALAGDDLFLIPTAEVPLTNLFAGETLNAADLPKALTAHSRCFRREAGAHGKDTRGLLRVHEFDKVELVRFATPETSDAELELLTGHAEGVLRALGLPYRVVLLAAGDTGFGSGKTYDLEVYAPGVGSWLEVSSCSCFTDFQARRANIRYRPEQGGKPRFVHTLNGSGLAFPRIIAAILEHYQNPDGSVTVPEPLRPYLGTDRLG
ncbi:MAG: serine--tRNA ligase [Gemmatimonadaceae bacterium]|nr:serine--tRNA ligase [Gemmatimonadaceae bacterium]